jgi:glycosyltransferase involved in cell wall biosynthesis
LRGGYPNVLPAGIRKPHIALIGHLAGAELYGAERSLLSLLAAIDRTRYEVSCILPGTNADYLRAVAKYTENVIVFPYWWWTKTRPYDQETVAHFEDLFQRRQVDLVHVNTITLMDPLAAAKRLHVPSIVHARELVDQDEELAGLFGEDPAAIVQRIRAEADFIIANSDTTHRLYHKEGRSWRLYNCIDIDAFDMVNEVAPGRLKIGIISSNKQKKGIEHFVKLAILAARRGLTLEFIVIGPRSQYTDNLAGVAHSEGGSVNLRFAGYAADPVEAMRQINVVVSFSSCAESFGRTLIEGMAARRPVIAYDLGAAPEIVRHGIDGFIIPPFDIAQALAHIEALADNPSCVTAMGETGRARVEELFAPPMFASNLNGIYRRILDK